MENQEINKEEIVKKIYQQAAHMMVEEGKSSSETIAYLEEQGLDGESATAVVNNLQQRIHEQAEESGSGSNDMIFGALWCIGGTIATLADIGYIFWGAIVFGALQFFKGVAANVQR